MTKSFARPSFARQIRRQAGNINPLSRLYRVSSSVWENVIGVQKLQDWVGSNDNWKGVCEITELRRKNESCSWTKNWNQRPRETSPHYKLNRRSKGINGERLSGSIPQEIEKMERGVRDLTGKIRQFELQHPSSFLWSLKDMCEWKMPHRHNTRTLTVAETG